MQHDIIIAAGELYSDIDIVACAFGYQELLKLTGVESTIVIPKGFNKSVTDKVMGWVGAYQSQYKNSTSSRFVIVDISEPEHIASFADESRIIKIIDHHFGFEIYWKQRLGNEAIIEKVGACATLIWQEYKDKGVGTKISSHVANLICTAILSNTLNFKAKVTDTRDHEAYEQVKAFADLPEDWIRTYFSDQEIETFRDPEAAVKNDTNVFSSPNLKHSITIGQLELWNSQEFMEKYLSAARSALESFGNEFWFLTSPSISEGKNYMYSENNEVKELLSSALGIHFRGNLAITDKLIMRKEIKKKLLEFSP